MEDLEIRNKLELIEADNNAIIFSNPSFDKSIIGITIAGNAVYDYDKMISEFMIDNNVSYEDASEFIDYNTIKSLDYLDINKRPIIMYKL